MFARSFLLSCCLFSGAFNSFAADVDMLRLQQLLKESDRLELVEEMQVPSTEKKMLSLQNINTPKRVLIDVRSTHSDGLHDMPMLISLAKKRGIDALAFTEHDRYSIRFGIAPMPNILGYSMQHPSLYVTGLDYFFSDLKQQRAQHP